MQWIIEFDGIVADVVPVHYQAHRQSTEAVGWSWLDHDTFRRLTRTKGEEAILLPGAKPIKIKTYHEQFTRTVEADDLVAKYKCHDGIENLLSTLVRYGACTSVTLGSNVAGRSNLLESQPYHQHITRTQPLSDDPRRRPAELKVLGGSEKAAVIASSDTLIRSADAAELFAIGVSTGLCTPARLHRAGASVVYKSLDEFLESLQSGAEDLIQAGLSLASI